MKMNLLLLPCLALFAALFTSQALAGPDGHGRMMIEHLDTDGDGLISIEEFRTPRGRRFEEADLDGDGIVTQAEMTQHHEARAAEHEKERLAKRDKKMARLNEHFAELDLNGDGGVTAEEAKQAIFNRLDKNGDGYISADEAKPHRDRMHDRRRHHKRHDSHSPDAG